VSAQTHVQRSRPQPHCGWQAMPARGAPKVRDEAVGRERARAVQHAPGNGRDGQPCCETRRGRRRLGVPFAREPRRRAMTRLQAPRFSPGRRGDRNRLLARHAVAPHFPSLCLQPLGVCFSTPDLHERRSGTTPNVSLLRSDTRGQRRQHARPASRDETQNVKIAAECNSLFAIREPQYTPLSWAPTGRAT